MRVRERREREFLFEHFLGCSSNIEETDEFNIS